MKAVVTMEKPIVVAQADPSVRGWGPYQFPGLEYLEDGRIHITYHVHADSAKAYGMGCGHAIFDEKTQEWKAIAQEEVPAGGYKLPNGDLIRGVSMKSIPVEQVQLPEPAYVKDIVYVKGVRFYRPGQISPEYEGWYYERKACGTDVWVREQLKVEMPEFLRSVREGVLPIPGIGRIINLQSGDIIMYGYYFFHEQGDDVLMRPAYLKSSDCGKTWKFLSSIPYQPDPSRDSKAAIRDGFTEPRTVQLKDGTLFTLLRTTDGKGVGPMYATISRDMGETWEKPWVVDDEGVLPAMLPLKNGVTLMAYGRPGLFMRATVDPACRELSDRITIVEPVENRQDTCSYSDLLPLSDDTALLAYSDFNYPNPDGVPVKTILTRVVHTRVE